MAPYNFQDLKLKNYALVLLIIIGGELTYLFVIKENGISLIFNKINKKVITLDQIFNKNDQLKTNTPLQMNDVGIEFKAV